jgi:hypothetical protein
VPETTLFIGVVSHLGSRYATSQGVDGLAARLGAEIPGSHVQVNTQDLLVTGDVDLTPRVIQDSLTAEVALEREWAAYLGTPPTARWWFRHGLRWARRAARAVVRPDDAGARRLLNIELSHLDLMRRGLDSDAPWTLIVEDDAHSDDIRDLARGLSGLMSAPSAGFVNLSLSFPLSTLGIGTLLAPSAISWLGSEPRQVLVADRPVTNTVCAILYSRSFLVDLVDAWQAMPLTPVIPIDWKLNRVLMDLQASRNGTSTPCLFVEPAPITQMSMQRTGILPG